MSILADSEALANTFVPEKLLHREKEQAQLLYNLKNSINTLIYGSIGFGKTALVKSTFSKFNGMKSKAIYIDCSLYQTTNSILREILSKMNVFVTSRSNYELEKKLAEKTKDSKPIICLDNFEQLKNNEIMLKLLGLNFCIILVSDSEESYALLDAGIKYSIPSIMQISEYTTEQAYAILINRAKDALTEGSYTDTIISKIAERVNGNIAEGINLLKSSALKAQSQNRSCIDEIDLEHDCPLAELTKDQRVILKILEEWKELPTGRLFAFYQDRAKYPKGERSFRKYMESLCEKGFVKADGDKRGRMYEIVESEDDESGKPN